LKNKTSLYSNISFVNCFITFFYRFANFYDLKGKTNCDPNFIPQIQEILIKIEEAVPILLSRILNTPATVLPSFANEFIGNIVLYNFLCFVAKHYV